MAPLRSSVPSAAIVRLLSAALSEQHDEWVVTRRYMSAESFDAAVSVICGVPSVSIVVYEALNDSNARLRSVTRTALDKTWPAMATSSRQRPAAISNNTTRTDKLEEGNASGEL